MLYIKSMDINSIKELNNLSDDNYLNILTVNLSNEDFIGNVLDHIPLKIFKLKNLQALHLANNKIAQIPEELFDLKNMVLLDLSHNCIEFLPSSFSKLVNLESLYLSDNLLQTIPSSLGKLIKLTNLFLDYNQLISLPIEISDISGLRLSSSSYKNLDNLSDDCEFISIDCLQTPLIKLPSNLKIIKLYNSNISPESIILPEKCKLYLYTF